jgi:addiction module HigA family antidote
VKAKKRPVHPGEILREEYMRPLALSANRLAAALHVPTNRLTEILNERRGVTADTALRLARAFGTTPQFWLNLQQAYELAHAQNEAGADIEKIAPLQAAKRDA